MQDSLTLKVGSKKRVNADSLFKGFNLSSVKAIINKKNKNITLIPQVKLPLDETAKIVPIKNAWFYNDKKIINSIKNGLSRIERNEVTPYEEITKFINLPLIKINF